LRRAEETTMCSILCIFEIQHDADLLRALALKLSRLQRHRGPDWTGVFSCDNAVMAHERLAIVDIEHAPSRSRAPTENSYWR
jgi:asparagine synthase (glutamine-hydrolysing)